MTKDISVTKNRIIKNIYINKSNKKNSYSKYEK